MGTAAIEKDQESLGRYGIAVFAADWTSTDYDDLNEEKILDVDLFAAGYSQPFYAVERIEWTASETVVGKVYFDSVPPGPDGLVLSIPQGASGGFIDFTVYPQGCRPDPARVALPPEGQSSYTAGNLVIDAEGLPTDSLYILVRYKEKGKHTL